MDEVEDKSDWLRTDHSKRRRRLYPQGVFYP